MNQQEIPEDGQLKKWLAEVEPNSVGADFTSKVMDQIAAEQVSNHQPDAPLIKPVFFFAIAGLVFATLVWWLVTPHGTGSAFSLTEMPQLTQTGNQLLFGFGIVFIPALLLIFLDQLIRANKKFA